MASEQDHDYVDGLSVIEHFAYKEAAVFYIADFVVNTVRNRINCIECVRALSVSRNTYSDISFLSLNAMVL